MHSRKIEATIALAIDELWMKVLVRHLESDACEYFGIEADELTDAGNMKTLLAKVRFPENGEIQNFVFNIFESVGDSESMYAKFLQGLIKDFEANNSTEEEVKRMLNKKLVYGTTDRASKIMKLGSLLEDMLDHYIHIACDNHITETAWERTQKEIEELEEVEQDVKDSYGLRKNSAKRTKRLQDISVKYEEDYRALRGIFKIRFLTSELSALVAKLIDHEQLLKMTQELSKDTSVKKARREEIKELHHRLKDSERFFNSLGVMEALEMISPYQKWGQKQDISALERE